MDLGSFLSDTATGSWADEMDSMPSAPAEFDDILAYKRGGSTMNDRDSSRYGGQDSESRPPRPDVPFPTVPPYTAFVGNLSFDTGEDEIRDMFIAENLSITSVRVVKDHAGKLKGFCYVEFPEAEMLRHALTLTNTPLGGRTIRVSVAEPPRAGDAGRSAGDWTRSGPLPDLPGRGGSSRPGGFGDRDRQSSGPPVDSGRDWGDVRGGKFAPSAPTSPSMGSRGGSFGGDRRDSAMGRGPPGGPGSFRDRQPSAGGPPAVADDRDWSSTRGAKFVATPDAPSSRGPMERRPSGFNDRRQQPEENREWRGPRAAPLSPPASSESPSAPPQRRKLELSARSVSSASPGATEATSPSSTSSKPNPFGGAAPVNTQDREKEIEARMAKEKEEAAEKAAAKRAADAAEAAERKKSSNPFGSAQPIDTSSREKEVEAKIAQEKEELAKKMQEAKLAPTSTSTPSTTASDEKGTKEDARPSGNGKSWRIPNTNHSSSANNFANSQAKANNTTSRSPSSSTSQSSNQNQQQQQTQAAAAAKEQKTFNKNQGIRKEGFSFANIARGSGASPSTEEPPESK